MPRLRMLALLGTLLVSSLSVSSSPAAVEGCAEPASGGEWRSYGRDLQNSRTQPLEDRIGPGNVAAIVPAWSVTMDELGAVGNFQSTPAVADGCVYVGTDAGWVLSLNADSGELNWKVQLSGGVFGLAVTEGLVVGLVNDTDEPYAIALRQLDGVEVWRSDPPFVRPGLRTNASTVIFDGMVFMGYSVVEGDVDGHAGYLILDLEDGSELARGSVIPPEDQERGYGGGGIWTTGVVDEDTKHVFVGTSNPTSKQIEHRHHNAVLKIDLDRSREATFGSIVDNAKGNYDQYYQGLDRQPACRETGDQLLYLGFSLTCFQFDLDFGASPNLFTDDEGNPLVGILQKSGVYHVFYADTLQQAWTQVLAPPCLQCNFASTAYDGSHIYGVGTPPGQMVAMDPHRGAYRWASPVGDGLHHQAVSAANGVVYTVDSAGFLDAFDAATGVPLLRLPVAAATGNNATALSSAGIAIARHTLYVPASSNLVAYRLPA